MNGEDAGAAMTYLAAMTTGWADDITAAYTVELSALDDPNLLMEAVRQVAAIWTDPWRPPLATIRNAYDDARAEQRRRELAATPPYSAVHRHRGAVVAWEAYVDECAIAGRTPDRARFGRLLEQAERGDDW